MTDVLFNSTELPEWEEMVGVLKQFSEIEQQRIFGYIQGAQAAQTAQTAQTVDEQDK